MIKVLPLSILMSLVGVLAGLTSVHAEAILSVLEGQPNGRERQTDEVQIREPMDQAPSSVNAPKRHDVHDVKKFPQQSGNHPLAKDPRHSFSEPCPACGMG